MSECECCQSPGESLACNLNKFVEHGWDIDVMDRTIILHKGVAQRFESYELRLINGRWEVT